jgi:pyruvate dehydrogenase E2 component (dihydrolipoamide acetyltransferase)
MAKEMGIDLKGIKGTGPGGSITKEDLLKEAKPKEERKPEDAFGPVERAPFRGLRRTVAENLLKSQRTTAFVTGMEEADITELWELREREKGPLKDKGIHLTFLPFFIKAVHHALREHPALNASLDEGGGEMVFKKYYNIGIAVDTPEGLMVPVVKGADKKTIVELAEELQRLAERAREALSPSPTTGTSAGYSPRR